MTTTTTTAATVTPSDLASRRAADDVVLLDVREDFEFADERIAGAEHVPLSDLDATALAARLAGRDVVVVCRTGARARDAAGRLGSAGLDARVLDGGLEAWRAAGLPVERPEGAPRLPIMRQVQIAAGSLVVLGVALGTTVSPWFLGLSAFVGCGLVFAGATGWCGMALLLAKMPWNRAAAAAASLVLVVATACGESTTPTWTALEADALDDTQRSQLETAKAARGALFSSLLGELTGALSDGETAAAIEVCSQRAPALAAEVSDTHDVEIGRTSWKLRNPANTPPAWARDAVDARASTPRHFASDVGDLGVLHPILVAETCLQCHGPTDSLAPSVRDALAALYPDDRATGFHEGDLRGWFWIEVPPADP